MLGGAIAWLVLEDAFSDLKGASAVAVLFIVILVQVAISLRKVEILLTAETLVILNFVGPLHISRRAYHYPGITDLRTTGNMEAGTYRERHRWGFLSYTTYESYYHLTVLLFNYNGIDVTIGKHMQEFDAEGIIKEVRKRKLALEKEVTV